MSVQASTDDVRQLEAQLHAAADDLLELDPTHAEAGRVVIAATRPPRRTGQLAAGQTVRALPGGGRAFVSTVGYWTFVHFGAPRAGVRAQPWLAEALARSADEVAEVYAAHARAALANVR